LLANGIATQFAKPVGNELIGQVHGKKLANAVAEICLQSRRRVASVAEKKIYPAGMDRRHPGIAKVIAAMKPNIATPLGQGELAAIFGRTPADGNQDVHAGSCRCDWLQFAVQLLPDLQEPLRK
jgi:hypothetical protein